MARAVAGALLLLCLFFDLVAISAADTTCSAAGAKAERDSPVCGTALLSQARDEIFAKRQRAVGEKVATISADGDTVIGKPDDEAFEKIGKDGTITVAEGKTMEHELEVVDERGRISPYSITDSKDSGAEPPEEAAPESVGSEVVGLAESAESSRSASVFQDHWITLADKGLGGATGAKKILQSVDAYQATWGAAVVWQVDLGDTYLLARIRIAWRLCKCYKPGSMTMEASTDGVSWHSFLQPSGLYVWGGRKIRDYRIVATARYVRIYATKASPVKWVAMWDVGFYGKMSDKRSNVYGWYHSYVAGVGGLSGTELIHLEAHDGKLFGGTGYWMHSGAFRAAEVVRLDCSFCQWKIDGRPQAYAGRIESLKSVRWTTDGSGSPLQGGPVDRLYAGYYLNWQGAGRVFLASRVDSTRTWVEGIAWARGPFKKNYFSARAVLLHQDKVTKVDHLFLSVGMDGILRGTFGSNVHWASQTETGPVPTRPLALIVCDGSVYFSSSSFIMRRNDGPSPTWSKVFDMANFDSQTVDEAVGGIRGLSSIGSSMLFAWAPNAQSAGCMVRLDPDGDGFTHHQESCVKELASNYLGKNKDGLPAMVVFVIANYNGVLAIPGSGGEGAKHIIGYQILLYGRSTNEFPVDPAQVSRTPSGKRMAYYAGAGFLIRHSAANYEVRQPGGPRYDPMFVFPKLTAVRCYANSPFGDGSVFMGGYDCNHFPSADTAWVMRGESSAIFGKPVPCQKELGCGHVPGEPFKSRGCDLCSGRHFLGPETAFFQRGKPTTCQAVMDHLNNNAPDNVCQEKKSTQVARKCCDGCDFCLGKNFVGSNIAKRRPDGSTLVCASALEYVRQGHATCYQGTAWWKTACCKS